MTIAYPVEGHCDCGNVSFHLHTAPLVVHCCHCRWCQRESGSSFALNALIEASNLKLVTGDTEAINIPTASGFGQTVVRCPTCKLALWSHYNGMGPSIAFIRVGTLTTPDLFPPDIHIFTSSKQPWVLLADDVPAVADYYDRKLFWSAESLSRWKIVSPQIKAHKAKLVETKHP